jgi:vitamin B12 transporter
MKLFANPRACCLPTGHSWLFLTIFFTLVLLMACPGLYAQTQLKEVVVTANRQAVPITDVLADVTVIDRLQIEQAGQTSIRELLAQQPGVQFTSNGSYASTTGLFLRGATSTQTIILVDGVRIGSATSGTAALQNLPLDRIDRIEILRGPASALYGADAVGGVVQIFTREPTPGLAAQARVGFGTDGLQQTGASVSVSHEGLGLRVGVTQESATGISVIKDPQSTNFNPDLDDFKANSADAQLTARINAQHRLSLSFLENRTDYRFDGRPSPNPLALTSLTSDAINKLILSNTALKWNAQWSDRWTSTLLLANSLDQSVNEYYRFRDNAYGGGDRFNTQRQQATWQNDLKFGKDVATLLLEQRSEAVDSTTLYNVTRRDLSATMASYALNRERWNALAVVRQDFNSQFGNFNNWSLSGGYRLNPQWRALASSGSSFQAPTFNQLYFPASGSFSPNPNLQPQLNRGNELGLSYAQGRLSLKGVAYYNVIQGFITPTTNVQESLAVRAGYTLTADLQQNKTRYSVSYDYTNPSSVSATTNDYTRLVRVAQQMLNARISHRIRNHALFAEYRLSSDREDAPLTGTTRIVLPGYSLINLGGDFRMNKELSMLLRVNNLANTDYMLANSFSMPGRTAFVGLNWSR